MVGLAQERESQERLKRITVLLAESLEMSDECWCVPVRSIGLCRDVENVDDSHQYPGVVPGTALTKSK